MRRKQEHTVSIVGCLLVLLGIGGAASGDGLIVPVRPEIRVRGNWAVKYHRVDIRVRGQVASVSIDQAFVNTGRATMEVEYLFPVPPGAAIDSMTLLVGGKEYAAKLLKADEARRIYESIVRQKKDPALLEYAGFGLYKTRAFPLDPGKPMRVQVTYKDVCTKDGDLVHVWYPLNTEKFSAMKIEDVEVTVDIKTKSDILAPYSPTHSITVDRKAPGHVIVTHRAKNSLPTQDFEIYYEESAKDVGAAMITHMPEADKDGYFMLLVSPNPRTASTRVWPKDVVLVLDRSGSMSGEKIHQAKEALGAILNNLNAKDRFNVVVYSDTVEAFYDDMVKVSESQVTDALERVDAIDASGGTDIHQALQVALKLLPADASRSRPKYVLFVTDGLPTMGKTDEQAILAETESANACGARIFTFGVGYDVNVRLLDKLAAQNHAKSGYVKKNEPVGPKITALYSKIKNPVMTGLKVDLQGVRIRDEYPRELGDLFDGDQIVLVGRYDQHDAQKLDRRATQLVITGMYEGTQRGFEYPVTLRAAGKDMRYAFVEKLWATRRVGFLLDQIQLYGKSKEVIDELVRLSMKFGIITPYTSFLADERTVLSDGRQMRDKALAAAKPMESSVTGGRAQADAAARRELNEAERSSDAGAGFADEALIGHDDVAKYTAGKKQNVSNMRNFAQQAVYQRGRVWLAANAADLDLDKDKSKIQEITRFSEEYFKLVRANRRDENEILASQREGEELVIRLRGQAHRIR